MDVTDSGVPVDTLISVVQRAVKQANLSSTDVDRDLRVVSVHLTLNAVATITAGGSLDFRVPFLGMKFKLGGSITRRDTHAIDIEMVPPDLLPGPELRDGEIESVLVEAVETIRTVMARASDGDDPFLIKTSFVDLTFAVTKDGSISIGVDGELRDEVTQTLRVGLEPWSPVLAAG
jgi:hypothetical protein